MLKSNRTIFGAVLLLIALSSIGSARAQNIYLDSVFAWEGRTLPAPLTIKADSSEKGEFTAVDYVVVGADGAQFAPFTSGTGFPSMRTSPNGWVEIRQSCGTTCTVSVIVDPATGRVSNTIMMLATIDHERGLAASLDDAGIVIFDPFGTFVEVPLKRADYADMGFAEWVGLIKEVAFVTDQDALYVHFGTEENMEYLILPFEGDRKR